MPSGENNKTGEGKKLTSKEIRQLVQRTMFKLEYKESKSNKTKKN